MAEPEDDTVDYVVVGSGAGGGTVAARLASAGMSVIVLEAGADPAELSAEGLPDDYDVPAFHPFASENKAMAWNYRVHDFGDDAERRPDVDAMGRRGVLYPRARPARDRGARAPRGSRAQPSGPLRGPASSTRLVSLGSAYATSCQATG